MPGPNGAPRRVHVALDPLDEWRPQAACRGVDIAVFFPAEESGARRGSLDEARRICAGCPVRTPCLEEALRTGEGHGMRGGLSVGERVRLVARREKGAAA